MLPTRSPPPTTTNARGCLPSASQARARQAPGAAPWARPKHPARVWCSASMLGARAPTLFGPGVQGKGIRLVQTAEQLQQYLQDMATTEVVMSAYVARPLLLRGCKFDLRIYVLVAACDPLRIYIYQQGLVRLCTQRYELPKVLHAPLRLAPWELAAGRELEQPGVWWTPNSHSGKWSCCSLACSRHSCWATAVAPRAPPLRPGLPP